MGQINLLNEPNLYIFFIDSVQCLSHKSTRRMESTVPSCCRAQTDRTQKSEANTCLTVPVLYKKIEKIKIRHELHT